MENNQKNNNLRKTAYDCMTGKLLSPWVFTTYACNCACPYCMVPKANKDDMNMSAKTFKKMLDITEEIYEKGHYTDVFFRLSGGEPLLNWKDYEKLVTDFKKKHKDKAKFGLLSNGVVLNDKIIDWMKRNQMGIQISLDDLENSKPLHSGKSSSFAALEAIEKLKKAKQPFGLNTVLDFSKTKDLTALVDYVCEQSQFFQEWGLSASFTLKDKENLEEIKDILKLAILRLKKNGFDIARRLRFYNEVIASPGRTCQAGVSLIALGTNLEVWTCQSLIDRKPLGFYSKDIDTLLKTSEDNQYFLKRTLQPQCTDCNVLNWCRGGCRAVYYTNDTVAAEVTCELKKELIPFIVKESYSNYNNNQNNCNCNHNHDNHEETLQKIFDKVFKEKEEKNEPILFTDMSDEADKKVKEQLEKREKVEQN